MILSTQIAWVAGLLEGEGCFRYNAHSPIIQIQMTDRDVIYKARSILSPNSNIQSRRRGGLCKETYQLHIFGITAIQWMMTIYPLMGDRRKAKIREVLREWKVRRSHRKKVA